MVVSLLSKVTCELLSVPLVLLRSESAKDAELLVLRYENTVLRRQLACPVRYEPADRLRFAALSRLIHPSHWREIFPVTRYGARLARQIHRLEVGLHHTTTNRTPIHPCGDQGTRTPTRPRKPAMGTSTDPRRVGSARIGASTVWEILNATGIDPAPRHRGPTWREFPTIQAEGIIAADFVHIGTALGTRLYALVFLEHGTTRLHITGVTTHPTRDWTVQQARNLAADLGTRMESHCASCYATATANTARPSTPSSKPTNCG